VNFTCPHCGRPQIATRANYQSDRVALDVGKFAEAHENGAYLSSLVTAVRCASETCNKIAIAVEFGSAPATDFGPGMVLDGSEFFTSMIYPRPCGKPFPDGVPLAMLEDYNEAWAIVDLSPKASATLARRCLQSMIRDFCNITRKNLHQEIEALEKALKDDELPKGVDVETVQAMKALRDVGNIGAHMSQMDGVIVNVDPGEAEALLKLIEMLFNDWYVARFNRRKALADIEAIGVAKVPPAPPTDIG
jgi:Domain of unknown function (DUF4145)